MQNAIIRLASGVKTRLRYLVDLEGNDTVKVEVEVQDFSVKLHRHSRRFQVSGRSIDDRLTSQGLLCSVRDHDRYLLGRYTASLAKKEN